MIKKSKIFLGVVFCGLLIAPVAFGHQKTLKIPFGKADLDSDGYITFLEIGQLNMNKFHLLDENRNGFLTSAEISNSKKQGKSKLFKSNTKKKRKGEKKSARYFVKVHDLDNDGRVSFAEFPNRWADLVKHLDLNGDNKLSPDEYE